MLQQGEGVPVAGVCSTGQGDGEVMLLLMHAIQSECAPAVLLLRCLLFALRCTAMRTASALAG